MLWGHDGPFVYNFYSIFLAKFPFCLRPGTLLPSRYKDADIASLEHGKIALEPDIVRCHAIKQRRVFVRTNHGVAKLPKLNGKPLCPAYILNDSVNGVRPIRSRYERNFHLRPVHLR